MKGFTSESLVIAGAYLISQSLWIGIAVLSLGCLSALIRFSRDVATDKKKEEFWELLISTFSSISSAARILENERTVAKVKESIH